MKRRKDLHNRIDTLEELFGRKAARQTVAINMEPRELALRICFILAEAQYHPTSDNLQAADKLVAMMKEGMRRLEAEAQAKEIAA